MVGEKSCLAVTTFILARPCHDAARVQMGLNAWATVPGATSSSFASVDEAPLTVFHQRLPSRPEGFSASWHSTLRITATVLHP
jgi:hypothetical protein